MSRSTILSLEETGEHKYKVLSVEKHGNVIRHCMTQDCFLFGILDDETGKLAVNDLIETDLFRKVRSERINGSKMILVEKINPRREEVSFNGFLD